MDKDSPRSVPDVPVQVLDDGSVILSEQRNLYYDADRQGRSIPNSSICGSEVGAPLSSTGPRSTLATKRGTVIGCGASPPPPPHLLVCARHHAAATAAAAAAAAAEGGSTHEGGDDDEEVPTDAQFALAVRAVYVRHHDDARHTQRTLMQKNDTELGNAECVIKTAKHEEAEAEAARGHHADHKLTMSEAAHAVVFTATLNEVSIVNFDDGARDDFEWSIATGLGVPRDVVRVTGAGARAGSVIVETSVTVVCDAEAAAAFASTLTDPAKPLVDGFRFGPCAVSGVHIEELAAAAVPEEAPEPAAASEPAPPPTPVVTVNGPLRSTVVVFHSDDDNGGLWDYEEEEAVRHDRGGASAAAAACGPGLELSQLLCTGVLTCQEEPPSPPALDNASATGRTYDDITKPPPPHLRCVVLPSPSLPPFLRCTAVSPPHFSSPTSRD